MKIKQDDTNLTKQGSAPGRILMKTYHTPQVTAWGNLNEITRGGTVAPVSDATFTGNSDSADFWPTPPPVEN